MSRGRPGRVLVVGGGHNGLVAACYLARGGADVLVLEQSDRLGGGSRTEETVPGHRFDTHSAAHNSIQATGIVEELDLPAAGLEYRVINAGVSGDTSAGGLRRLAWLLRMPVSVLVLELGANDMLRGQSVEQLRTNLETILERTREAHPSVKLVIAGMRAAPNLGREYGERFDAVYPALAKKYGAPLVPFLLEDVAARRHLNQADGIHPTAEGHELIATRMWEVISPVLR